MSISLKPVCVYAKKFVPITFNLAYFKTDSTTVNYFSNMVIFSLTLRPFYVIVYALKLKDLAEPVSIIN